MPPPQNGKGRVYPKPMPIEAMITEDDLLSMAMLRDLLEDNFPEIHIVGMFKTVKESLAFLKEHKIDLLFLDIELPDGNGFDILERSENKDFSVIITTSYVTYSSSGKFINLVDFLVKPVTPGALQNAMRRYNQQIRII
jgi:two-component SAPR family response regulator